LPFVPEALVQWRLPERSEIVVFSRPDDPQTVVDEAAEHLVKRVIALPGEKVEMVARRVFIDGRELNEPYAKWIHGSESHQSDNWGPAIVPAGELFVLGDNREVSRDSRVWKYPFVKVERLQGRAALVYWSGSDAKRSGTVLW
jgi:signal peptidase I